ncbi:beta-lactamase family protein [Georgenia sp. TF02-10]|nr:beta-lactamase family protein [Georgenia sp. TF02-10]
MPPTPTPDRPTATTTATAEKLTAFPAPFPVTGLVDPVPATLPAADAAALTDVLTQALTRGGIRGGYSAVVVDAERGTWTGAVGTADGTRPMTSEHQFAIGSLTQTVVAAEVLRLAETGLLGLDEPIERYLPAGLGFDTNDATVREVLGMRSGIPDFRETVGYSITVHADPMRAWTPAEVLGLVGDTRFRKGTIPSESATNYVLAGLVVETVTGRELHAALRAGVLAGPGLDRLVLQPGERPTEPVAIPFGVGLEPGTWSRGGGYLLSLSEASAGGAARAMVADAPSLARWWTRLCGGHVVSGTSLTEMATFPSHQIGLGLHDLTAARGTPAVGAYGSTPGFAAFAACLPRDGLVVVVLTNHYLPFGVYDVALELLDAVRDR